MAGQKSGKKGSKPPPRIAHLEESCSRHRQHITRLEQVPGMCGTMSGGAHAHVLRGSHANLPALSCLQMLRLLDNDAISPDDVDSIKASSREGFRREQIGAPRFLDGGQHPLASPLHDCGLSHQKPLLVPPLLLSAGPAG